MTDYISPAWDRVCDADGTAHCVTPGTSTATSGIGLEITRAETPTVGAQVRVTGTKLPTFTSTILWQVRNNVVSLVQRPGSIGPGFDQTYTIPTPNNFGNVPLQGFILQGTVAGQNYSATLLNVSQAVAAQQLGIPYYGDTTTPARYYYAKVRSKTNLGSTLADWTVITDGGQTRTGQTLLPDGIAAAESSDLVGVQYVLINVDGDRVYEWPIFEETVPVQSGWKGRVNFDY